MAETTAGFDLTTMVDSLSLLDAGGSESEAVQSAAKILGAIVPAAVEGVGELASSLAESFALRKKRDPLQTAAFIITKAAIMETLQVVGVGGGLAKFDLTAFNIAQLKANVEEINRKIDVILEAPFGQAVEFLEKALTHLDRGNFAKTIEELKNVKHNAVTAFQYAEGKADAPEVLRCKVLAKQLVIFSEILEQSYDGTMIIPFPLLEKSKKETIGKLIEIDVNSVQNFYNSQSISKFSWNRAEKQKRKEDTFDSLLQKAYPFISEGRGLTSNLGALELPFDLKVLPKYLPEGEEDAAHLVVGQLDHHPFHAKVWKEGHFACCTYGSAAKNTERQEVTFQVTPGWF